ARDRAVEAAAGRLEVAADLVRSRNRDVPPRLRQGEALAETRGRRPRIRPGDVRRRMESVADRDGNSGCGCEHRTDRDVACEKLEPTKLLLASSGHRRRDLSHGYLLSRTARRRYDVSATL